MERKRDNVLLLSYEQTLSFAAHQLSQRRLLCHVVEHTGGTLPCGFTASPCVRVGKGPPFFVLTKAIMRRAGLSVLVWVDDGLCVQTSL